MRETGGSSWEAKREWCRVGRRGRGGLGPGDFEGEGARDDASEEATMAEASESPVRWALRRRAGGGGGRLGVALRGE